VVRHAGTGRPQVALTFHGAGDPALADQLLTEAERGGAAVTVLAVGTWLASHPEMAQRILHGGHALGNHTYTHPTLHRLSPAGIEDEVARCAALLTRLIGNPGAAFRPSGGPSITPPMVSAATSSGYRLVLGYDVDPSDNLDPGASAVASRVLAEVRPGSIVSLHLGHAGTVEALPHILTGLRSRGLSAVTAPRLVAPT
jgi:peptidoglycan/xylan/chitin deacetylase (PgdA/CDA1 family)